MSIDSNNFRLLIVRAPLQSVNITIKGVPFPLWSPDSEELMMMTAAQETRLGEFFRQGWKLLNDARGVGLGPYSMEPATHADTWRYIGSKQIQGLPWPWMQTDDTLIWNLKYTTVMARLKYLQAPAKIPAATDIEGLAHYWKQWYNTPLGRGTAEEVIENYHKYVQL